MCQSIRQWLLLSEQQTWNLFHVQGPKKRYKTLNSWAIGLSFKHWSRQLWTSLVLLECKNSLRNASPWDLSRTSSERNECEKTGCRVLGASAWDDTGAPVGPWWPMVTSGLYDSNYFQMKFLQFGFLELLFWCSPSQIQSIPFAKFLLFLLDSVLQREYRKTYLWRSHSTIHWSVGGAVAPGN